jgi:hypothetical protein
MGGSDPENLLGGSTSQKAGSLPPIGGFSSAVFFQGRTCGLGWVSRACVWHVGERISYL